MAIAKVKTQKMEWTTASLVQAAVAGVLVLLAVILGYVAVRKFGLKRSISNALVYYDSNRVGNAKPALESALGWNEEHHVARELLAKIQTEGGELPQAEQNYQRLLAAYETLDESRMHGGVSAHKAVAHYGLGVIALKKADREKAWTSADPFVKQAREFFNAAKAANAAMPEAQIGLHHCDLIALSRAPALDADKARALAGQLEKVRQRLSTDIELGKSCTKEGLVDLYAGLGWCYAVAGQQDDAFKYTKATFQYAPGWVLPLVNMVYIEAQRYATTRFEPQVLRQRDNEVRQFAGDLKNKMARESARYGVLREPWFQYCLSVAWAYGRIREMGLYGNWMHSIKQEGALAARLDVPYIEAVMYYSGAILSDLDPIGKMTFAEQMGQQIDQFLKHETMSKPENQALKATLLNNLGYVDERRGSKQNSQQLFDKAVNGWKESLNLEESYEATRNIAVLQKRRGKADAQEFYDKAAKIAAGSGDERVKKDWEGVQKFWSQ